MTHQKAPVKYVRAYFYQLITFHNLYKAFFFKCVLDKFRVVVQICMKQDSVIAN